MSAMLAQALYLLALRCNLLVEPRDLRLGYRFPLAIGALKLREVGDRSRGPLGALYRGSDKGKILCGWLQASRNPIFCFEQTW